MDPGHGYRQCEYGFDEDEEATLSPSPREDDGFLSVELMGKAF